MSYILDALKKSEQQRGHGDIPNVQTIHSSSLNYRDDKKTYWPYILIAAITLNFAAIIYFIIDKDTSTDEKTLSVMGSNISNSTEKNTTANSDYKKNTDKQDISSRRINTAIKLEQTKTATAAITAVVKNNTNNKSIALSAAKSTTIPTRRRPPPPKEIIDFYDLPTSIKQQLPAIIVSAHIYSSNPLQRSIVVNNNFLEEGEYVIDDLILHEITADGAIFDYNGTLFRYGVVSGWQ